MTSLMTTLISPLLQESLAIDAVLAHRGRLPGKVGATGVALKTIFTIISNQFTTNKNKNTWNNSGLPGSSHPQIRRETPKGLT